MLVLSGCSGKDASQSFLDIRTAYLSADITLSADVRADYGDRCYEYSLSYTGDGKSGEVSILSPEEISGISASIGENKKVSLKCGDTLIDTGILYGAGVSPVETLPLIVNAIREGYVSTVYTETLNGVEYITVEIDKKYVNIYMNYRWYDQILRAKAVVNYNQELWYDVTNRTRMVAETTGSVFNVNVYLTPHKLEEMIING